MCKHIDKVIEAIDYFYKIKGKMPKVILVDKQFKMQLTTELEDQAKCGRTYNSETMEQAKRYGRVVFQVKGIPVYHLGEDFPEINLAEACTLDLEEHNRCFPELKWERDKFIVSSCEEWLRSLPTNAKIKKVSEGFLYCEDTKEFYCY